MISLPLSRKTLFLISTIFLIITLPIFIFLVQKNQENRTHASAGTTLKLEIAADPTKPLRTVGDPVQIVMSIDPGTQNIISVVSFDITYDKTKLTPNAQQPFTLNASLPAAWQPIAPVKIDSINGKITGTYTVSSSFTQAIQKPSIFGTFAFTTIASTEGQNTIVGFSNTTATYSIGTADTANENVLATATPVQFSIASSAVPTPIPACNTTCSTNSDCQGASDGCTTCNTSTNKCIPAPSSAPVCLSVITSAVNDTTGVCQTYGSSCIPTGWHEVTACPPAQTPTITLTPINSTFTVNGRYIDENGNYITLPNQKVSLKRVDIADPQLREVTDSPSWTFANIPYGTYEITAAAIPGYSTSISPCRTCGNPVFAGNQLQFGVTGGSNPEDIYIIYRKDAYLAINVGLHGIGYAGDNAAPGRQVSFSPTNPAPSGPDAPKLPIALTRQSSVQLYDQQNQLLYSSPITLQFSPDTYTFGSIFPLTQQAITAVGGKTVSIRLNIPKYLTVFYPLVKITSSGTTNLAYIPVTAGNVYNDASNTNQLDILDYNAIMDCREDVDTANKSGVCSVDADINGDGRVDVFDYNLLIREMSIQNGR